MKRQIIAMEPDYLDLVLAIEQASFKDPWPPTAFRNELQHSWSWFRLAVEPDPRRDAMKVLGYIVCWILPGDMHLLDLAVEKDSRRTGIATELLLDGIEAFGHQGGGTAYLEVRPSNLAAQKMYLAQGFEIVGRRPAYYRWDKEDALVMSKKIARNLKISLNHRESQCP